MICTAVSYRRISRAALMPLMPGISTSRNSTSKRTPASISARSSMGFVYGNSSSCTPRRVRYCSRKSCIWCSRAASSSQKAIRVIAKKSFPNKKVYPLTIPHPRRFVTSFSQICKLFTSPAAALHPCSAECSTVRLFPCAEPPKIAQKLVFYLRSVYNKHRICLRRAGERQTEQIALFGALFFVLRSSFRARRDDHEPDQIHPLIRSGHYQQPGDPV